MAALADAAGRFAEKLAELLDVFDFSFFLAGAAALGGIVAWMRIEAVGPTDLDTQLALASVIAAYVLGMICAAAGRWVRDRILGFSAGAHLASIADAHHLFTGRYSEYASTPEKLYARLWVLVRTEKDLAETFTVVKKYWVLAAAYDGLIIAAIPWLIVMGHPRAGIPMALRMGFVVALLGSMLIAAVQARKYRIYQVEELAATAAFWASLDRDRDRAPDPDAKAS